MKEKRVNLSMLIKIYCRFILLFIVLFTSPAYPATTTPPEKDCPVCEKTPPRFPINIPAASPNPDPITKIATNTPENMVKIPAGTFMMGGDNEQARPDEYPKHKVTVSSFWMDQTQVTNKQFRRFVDATQYVTTAEKAPDWE